jgi:hypothetical protein
MSRPKKAAGTHLSITAIRMPPQVKVRLETLSHDTGLAQQEHIRRALDNYFDMLQKEGKWTFDPARTPAKRIRRRRAVPAPAPQQEVHRRVFRRPGSVGAAA